MLGGMLAFFFIQSGLPLPVEDSLRLGAYTRCDKASIKENMDLVCFVACFAIVLRTALLQSLSFK